MTATSTLTEIMSSILYTTVELAKIVFTTYWPYILIFGVIAGIVAVCAKFLRIGTKK